MYSSNRYLKSSWTVYSQWSTPQQDWFTAVSAATRQHLSIWLTICSGSQMTAWECDFGQLCPTNWSCAGHNFQQLETAPLASPHLAFGTVCRHVSPQRIHCQLSRIILKLTCSTRDLRIVYFRSNQISNRISRPIRFRIESSNRIGRIPCKP